tara:strand:- start:21 stop:557 length:537 start_codon:yes stop_codon:yes gene_type:complete
MAKKLSENIEPIQENYQESKYNPFDAPIPGESLTNTPGAAAWEHPPVHAKIEDAIEFITESLAERKNGERALTLMKTGTPIEALVKVITFSGFLEGKWTVDVAKMLEPMVAMLLAKMGTTAGLKNMRININDESDTEFYQSLAMHEDTKKQEEMGGLETAELPQTESAGLMTRPAIGA